MQLTEKGVIGDTYHNPRNPDPDNHNNPVHHNPHNPDPDNHNNDRGMSNSHMDKGRSSGHKHSGNKLGEVLQLPEER